MKTSSPMKTLWCVSWGLASFGALHLGLKGHGMDFWSPFFGGSLCMVETVLGIAGAVSLVMFVMHVGGYDCGCD